MIKQDVKKQDMTKLCRTGGCLVLILFSAISLHIGVGADKVMAKTVPSGISAKSVKVGKQIRIKSSKKNVVFKSSNTSIASVDAKGIITGKKKGKVRISAKCKGYKKKTYLLTVKKNSYKPSCLPVTFSEISMKDVQMKNDGAGNPIYYARIRNKSKKGKIKKIIYYYEIQEMKEVQDIVSGAAVTVPSEPQVQKTNVTLTAVNIAAGKTSSLVRCKGDYTGQTSNMRLLRIDLYTGDARYRYSASPETYSFQWGTRDKKAPKIKGLVKKKSDTGNNDIFRVYYSDKKNSYNFKSFVSAVDDRDGRVKVKADTSKINWRKSGTYKLYFTAKDKAGNIAKSWAKVQVIVPGTAESIADEVLRSITRTKWSDSRKAKAIYRYIRGSFGYVNSSAHTHWRTSATKGIRYHSGDCYTYYSVARLLLTRAGIPNVMIKRYPTTYGRHFWNLVYVRGGWYHFDTTPRTRRGNFCLKTDAQLRHYSSGYTFSFIKKLYPARATKIINTTP